MVLGSYLLLFTSFSTALILGNKRYVMLCILSIVQPDMRELVSVQVEEKIIIVLKPHEYDLKTYFGVG